MTARSIAQVAEYRPLTRCGLEELAAHQVTAAPSGGVLFARKQEHQEKDAAREAILDLFTRGAWESGLSILTMPGVDWKFERKLLGRREGDWFTKAGPHRTYLTCIENDRAIYHCALTRMPGMQMARRVGNSFIQVLPPTSFAERVVRNAFIGRFFFGNVDDLMREQPEEHAFDAAWLDYTGPLSIARMRVIERFFARSVRRILIVTALKARWNTETSSAIDRAGSHSAWVLRHLVGDVLHDLEYQDGASPMAQIAIAHKGAAS